MFVTKTGLSVKIPDSATIKNLIRVGQIVEADVVDKKGDLTYIIKIKGQLFEAKANIPITSKKLSLLVKSLSPQIVLKIVEPEEQRIDFVKYNQPIVIEDEPSMIKNILNALKEALSNKDRLKAIVQITKLASVVKDSKIKEAVKNLEDKLVKQRIFDENGLKQLIETLSKESQSDTKKLTHLIKEALKNIQPNHPNNNENLFLQVPFLINSKSEEIYIKRDLKSQGFNKKSYRISLIWKNTRLGLIQIDALYTDGSISCNLFFAKEQTLKAFQEREKELENQLKGINLSLNLMKKEPILNEKHLNLRI